MLRQLIFIFVVLVFASVSLTNAQTGATADTSQYLTLDQCLDYALQHQPSLMRSNIGITIAKKTNAIALSAWLPQVNLVGNLTHYFELPTGFQTNQANPEGPPLQVKTGIVNTATPAISASETIFSPDVLYAAKSAHLYVLQAQQTRDSTVINLVAIVSKSFYNLLLTIEQINVLKEDTARLAKNLSDSYHQYIGGTVDKTDFEEATISLNNSKAQLKQAVENIRPQYASLKQTIGYPPDKEFNVLFDTTQMMKEIAYDTTQQLQYEKRIELQELETAKSLQHQSANYYRYAFLPTVSAFYNYTYEYENSSFPPLFNQAYPFSYIGGSVSIPLFTGLRRLRSVQRAKLQEQLLDWDIVDLKSSIYTEYTTSLANYKSNLYNLGLLKDNVTMAKDAYSVVSLQYREGVVAYLNLITAESNLVSSEINYITALFQVLSSKVDLEKAMGNISANRL